MCVPCRLLTLWFDHGHLAEVHDALTEGIRTIDIDTWLQVRQPSHVVFLLFVRDSQLRQYILKRFLLDLHLQRTP